MSQELRTTLGDGAEAEENEREMENEEDKIEVLRTRIPSTAEDNDESDEKGTRKFFRVPSGMYEGKVAWTNHPCSGDVTKRVTFYVLGRDARSSMPITDILGAMENALQLTTDEQEAVTALESGVRSEKPKRERPPKSGNSVSTARSSGSSNTRHLISTYGMDEADILPPANEPGEERRSGRALKPNTLFLGDDIITTLHRVAPSQPTKPVTIIAEPLPSSSIPHAKIVSKERPTAGGSSSGGGGSSVGGDIDSTDMMVRKYVRVPQGVYTGRIAWISHVQDRDQLGEHAVCVNVLRMGPDRPSARTTVVASFIRDHWDDDLVMTSEEQEAVQATIDGTTFRGTLASARSTGSSGSVFGGSVGGGAACDSTATALGVKMEVEHADVAVAHRLLALASMTGHTHAHAPSHAHGLTSTSAGTHSIHNFVAPLHAPSCTSHTPSYIHLPHLQTNTFTLRLTDRMVVGSSNSSSSSHMTTKGSPSSRRWSVGSVVRIGSGSYHTLS